MTTVGVRQLKSRLSEYLRLVAEGELVLVTDRGRPVAELRPPGPYAESAYPRLLESAALGKVRLGAPPQPEVYDLSDLTAVTLPPSGVAGLLDALRSES